jgi:ubiquinone biosynthesis protein UbiJ
MLQSVGATVLPAVQARLVLIVNHVLAHEPQAGERMRAHASRVLRVEWSGLPPWLPALPSVSVRVTPIGWFELEPAAEPASADLTLRVTAPRAAQVLAALGGDVRPQVQIDGDAALAGDVQWLVANLRWDIEADMAEVIGPMAAHELMRAGRGAAAVLRRWVPVAPAEDAAGR